MNIRKIGIGALIVLAPLFNGCKKAAGKFTHAKQFLTEEVASTVAKKYSPVDSVFVKGKEPNDIQRACFEGKSKLIYINSKIGVNKEGKTVAVYNVAPDKESRIVLQIDKKGRGEKVTQFNEKLGCQRTDTVIYDKQGQFVKLIPGE